MAGWLPFVSLVLPHVAQIVTAAAPAFTSKPGAASDRVLAQQIAELQAAATANANSIKSLAEQLQQTLQTLDASAADMQRAMQQARRTAVGALVIALLALGTALGVLWAR